MVLGSWFLSSGSLDQALVLALVLTLGSGSDSVISNVGTVWSLPRNLLVRGAVPYLQFTVFPTPSNLIWFMANDRD